MSEPNNVLRIDHLRLQNFRCFAYCELELHPTLTVLVADNAQGKTALLDALRLTLQDFVTTVGGGQQARGFERTDIHLKRGLHDGMESQLPTAFQVKGQAGGEDVSWSRVLSTDSFHARTSTRDSKNIRQIAKRLADERDVTNSVPVADPTLLPVVAYYGTGRLYDEHRLTEGKRLLAESSPARTSAYLDCLSPSSSYKSFSTWFGQKWEQVGDPRFRAAGFESRPENHINVVREAVSAVLAPTGWTTIVWQPTVQGVDVRTGRSGYIALEHAKNGRLPLSHLSDGVRNMVALVGDIAHRCARLNPFLEGGAAKQTPGIILIDEVEMHLHPRWQQLVIGLLRTAFPCVQFVMSSHSPQVLSTLTRENIRKLGQNKDGGWRTSSPAEETIGVESSTMLNDVMGVNPVPPVEQADWRNDYTALVESGAHETQEGLALRSKLVTAYGARHPLVLDLDRLIRFQAFKQRKSRPTE